MSFKDVFCLWFKDHCTALSEMFCICHPALPFFLLSLNIDFFFSFSQAHVFILVCTFPYYSPNACETLVASWVMFSCIIFFVSHSADFTLITLRLGHYITANS